MITNIAYASASCRAEADVRNGRRRALRWLVLRQGRCERWWRDGLAERVGATRREPTRVEHDRHGVPRTLAVFIVEV
jgi:hypothetical protein